jgi:hypothetical protein
MANCSFKITLDSGKEWECPLEALPGEKRCYWHKVEGGKEPTKEQLRELKEKEIFGVFLKGAKLQHASLFMVELQNAYLGVAELQNANLGQANLQNANLIGAKLQNADLKFAKLQNVIFRMTSLEGTYLSGVRFDSGTVLEGSQLVDANLYLSYFDEAKSFRNAKLFRTETSKEINELIGDALGKKTKVSKKNARLSSRLKPTVLYLAKIEGKNPYVAAKIMEEGLVRYAGWGNKIMFFDRSSQCAIKNPEKGWRHKAILVEIDGLSDLIIKDDEIQPEFIYDGSRAEQFEASYEVYNNLYNFYKSSGSLDQAAHVHYRRGEAHRKLLREKGGFYWLKSWVFDFFVLRLLTGYGDKIERPIGASATLIALFALLFWLTDGIVKTVNGTIVSPGWLDYFYHSITTFTSLGYSNIQPNLAVGSLPQIVVAAESVLGILLMALIIFVVTYQVSR